MYSAFFTHASGHMISATDRRERPNARWIIRMDKTFTYSGLSSRLSLLSLQLLNVPHVSVASYLSVCCAALRLAMLRRAALRCLHLYLNVFKRPTIWERPRRALSVAGPCTLIHCLARTRNFFASQPEQRANEENKGATDKPICLCVFGFGCRRWDKNKYVALVKAGGFILPEFATRPRSSACSLLGLRFSSPLAPFAA